MSLAQQSSSQAERTACLVLNPALPLIYWVSHLVSPSLSFLICKMEHKSYCLEWNNSCRALCWAPTSQFASTCFLLDPTICVTWVNVCWMRMRANDVSARKPVPPLLGCGALCGVETPHSSEGPLAAETISTDSQLPHVGMGPALFVPTPFLLILM